MISSRAKLKNISKIGEVSRPVINVPPKKEEEVFKFGDEPASEANEDMSEDGPLDFTF